MSGSRFSRREFIHTAVVTGATMGAGGLVAACSTDAPPHVHGGPTAPELARGGGAVDPRPRAGAGLAGIGGGVDRSVVRCRPESRRARPSPRRPVPRLPEGGGQEEAGSEGDR